MEVQIFGLKNDNETRKADRFFAERRIKIHMVDLKVRPIAVGELTRFVQKLGTAALINTRSKRFVEQGMAHLRLTEAQWADKLMADPSLLLLPLVRYGQKVTAGNAESTWKQWIEESRA